MNCNEFRQNWTEWHEGWMDPVAGEGMTSHRDRCTDCARYDRQMSRMVGALARLPLPEEAPVAARRPARAWPVVASSWVGGPRWVALAATLVLGVALGVLLDAGFDDGRGIVDGDNTIVARPVALGEPGDHRIAVAFDSPRRIEQVEFVVELPEGAELIGFPGQRVVRWQGRLAAGRSRLQLPLHVTGELKDGQLITRIVHDGSERRLVVPLEAPAGDGSVARHTARA